MVPDNRREDVEKFVDPQLAKAMELLVSKKQLQAKTKPEEGKPEEKEKEQEPQKKEADSKPEKKAEAKDDDKPADKPE